MFFADWALLQLLPEAQLPLLVLLLQLPPVVD
jgi:hypothetical protein